MAEIKITISEDDKMKIETNLDPYSACKILMAACVSAFSRMKPAGKLVRPMAGILNNLKGGQN